MKRHYAITSIQHEFFQMDECKLRNRNVFGRDFTLKSMLRSLVNM